MLGNFFHHGNETHMIEYFSCTKKKILSCKIEISLYGAESQSLDFKKNECFDFCTAFFSSAWLASENYPSIFITRKKFTRSQHNCKQMRLLAPTHVPKINRRNKKNNNNNKRRMKVKTKTRWTIYHPDKLAYVWKMSMCSPFCILLVCFWIT